MQLSCYYRTMIESCLTKLESHRLRRTATRVALLDILNKASGPLPPPEIVSRCHRTGRKANKTTVYRDLAAMERSGIIRRVMVSDRTQYYELTERGHHHHFICIGCDSIRDVAIEDAGLMAQARRLGTELQFVIEEHALEFYGRCSRCLS